MGKRDEKKRQLRSAILAASRTVFETMGFRQTTMEQIAAEAEVGVGTAYNYFSSKEELFLLAVAEPLFAGASKPSLSVETGGAAEQIFAYLAQLVEGVESYGKDIWRDVISAFFSTQRANSELSAEMLKADLGMIEGLRHLLLSLRERGSLEPGYDAETCVKVLYAIFTSHLTWYAFDEGLAQETLLSELEKQIRFVFGVTKHADADADADVPMARSGPSGRTLTKGALP